MHGAGKIPRAHRASEADEAAEPSAAPFAGPFAGPFGSERRDAMSHRVRTSPGVAMALDILGMSFETKRTRRAHALLSALGGVSGLRRIASSAPSP